MKARKKPSEINVEPETLRWLSPVEVTVHGTGDGSVRLTIENDRSYLQIAALRAFPQTDPGRFIQLFSIGEDGDRDELIGMLESLEGLNEAAEQAIRACLADSYLVPKITCIVEIEEKGDLCHWVVETDRGPHEFEMESLHENVRVLSDGRALCRDTQDNRYEIPNVAELDPESRSTLGRYI